MKTGAQGNKAIIIRFQKVFIYPWLIVKTFKIGRSDKLTEIFISLDIFYQKDEMKRCFIVIPSFIPTARILIQSAAGCNIGFTSNYGLYTIMARLLVKLNCPKHIPVVSHGKGGHPVLLGKLKKVVMPYCPVKKAILCMQM